MLCYLNNAILITHCHTQAWKPFFDVADVHMIEISHYISQMSPISQRRHAGVIATVTSSHRGFCGFSHVSCVALHASVCQCMVYESLQCTSPQLSS